MTRRRSEYRQDVYNTCEHCKKEYHYILTLKTPENITRWCPTCISRYMKKQIKNNDKQNYKSNIKKYNELIPLECEQCGKIYFVKSIQSNHKKICDDCININKQSEEYKDDLYYKWARRCLYSHRDRGHTVLINIEELIDLAKRTKYCNICGTKLSYFSDVDDHLNRYVRHATLDRILNTTTYTIDEVGILCNRCNSIKGNLNINELKNIINGYIKYIKKVDPSFNPYY